MDWSASDRRDLEALLRKARGQPLDAEERRRLRGLVAVVNPDVSILPDDRLVNAGMIAYGARVAYELLTGEAPSTA